MKWSGGEEVGGSGRHDGLEDRDWVGKELRVGSLAGTGGAWKGSPLLVGVRGQPSLTDTLARELPRDQSRKQGQRREEGDPSQILPGRGWVRSRRAFFLDSEGVKG